MVFTQLPCTGFREAVPTVPFLIFSKLCRGSLVFCEALHTRRACWHFFKMACIYLIKSYVNLDANLFQPSGCLASCLVCSRCWKSLHTTVAPRESFKHVIPFLFFLIKVIVPQRSLNYLPSSERKGYFSPLFSHWQLQKSRHHCSLKMSLAGPLVFKGAPGTPLSSLLGPLMG